MMRSRFAGLHRTDEHEWNMEMQDMGLPGDAANHQWEQQIGCRVSLFNRSINLKEES
jgi:hypothetical protein